MFNSRSFDGRIIPDYIKLLHDSSMNNAEMIRKSSMCGCFYCLEMFESSKIVKWVRGERTAICPFCEVDSVLGDACGHVLNHGLLRMMHSYWFGNCSDKEDMQ
jgi:hypothetical protein